MQTLVAGPSNMTRHTNQAISKQWPGMNEQAWSWEKPYDQAWMGKHEAGRNMKEQTSNGTWPGFKLTREAWLPSFINNNWTFDQCMNNVQVNNQAMGQQPCDHMSKHKPTMNCMNGQTGQQPWAHSQLVPEAQHASLTSNNQTTCKQTNRQMIHQWHKKTTMHEHMLNWSHNPKPAPPHEQHLSKQANNMQWMNKQNSTAAKQIETIYHNTTNNNWMNKQTSTAAKQIETVFHDMRINNNQMSTQSSNEACARTWMPWWWPTTIANEHNEHEQMLQYCSCNQETSNTVWPQLALPLPLHLPHPASPHHDHWHPPGTPNISKELHAATANIQPILCIPPDFLSAHCLCSGGATFRLFLASPLANTSALPSRPLATSLLPCKPLTAWCPYFLLPPLPPLPPLYLAVHDLSFGTINTSVHSQHLPPSHKPDSSQKFETQTPCNTALVYTYPSTHSFGDDPTFTSMFIHNCQHLNALPILWHALKYQQAPSLPPVLALSPIASPITLLTLSPSLPLTTYGGNMGCTAVG